MKSEFKKVLESVLLAFLFKQYNNLFPCWEQLIYSLSNDFILMTLIGQECGDCI